jgi:hypothetical protein
LAHASAFTTPSNTTLPSIRHLNAQSSNNHKFTWSFTQTIQLLHKQFYHFSPQALPYYPLWKTGLKQCHICDYHHLMWHYEHKNTFTGSLTVAIDITCTRCIVHTHLDTLTAHQYSSWNKKEELLQNTCKQNYKKNSQVYITHILDYIQFNTITLNNQ